MQEAAERLAVRQIERNGEAVTYTRDGTDYTEYLDADGETIPLIASIVRTRSERIALEEGRANLEQQPADWIFYGAFFRAESGTGLVEPKDGDRITQADGTVWELGARDQEWCYRRSDQWGYALRLRCVRVDANEI